MTLDKRTEKDRIYATILTERGPLTNAQLRKIASESSVFSDKDNDAMEKDVDRFVRHYVTMGILSRSNGKLHWLTSSTPPNTNAPRIQAGQFILHKDGFLTSKAGVRCRHCQHTIDLTKVKIWRRIKSDTLLRILHVHHFFWVTCDHCNVKARYDMNDDVKPILLESAE